MRFEIVKKFKKCVVLINQSSTKILKLINLSTIIELIDFYLLATLLSILVSKTIDEINFHVFLFNIVGIFLLKSFFSFVNECLNEYNKMIIEDTKLKLQTKINEKIFSFNIYELSNSNVSQLLNKIVLNKRYNSGIDNFINVYYKNFYNLIFLFFINLGICIFLFNYENKLILILLTIIILFYPVLIFYISYLYNSKKQKVYLSQMISINRELGYYQKEFLMNPEFVRMTRLSDIKSFYLKVKTYPHNQIPF